MRQSKQKFSQFFKKLQSFVLLQKHKTFLTLTIDLKDLENFQKKLCTVGIIVDPGEKNSRKVFELQEEGGVDDGEGDLGMERSY